MALDLFDAFGSGEKSPHANLGGHTGVRERPRLRSGASSGVGAGRCSVR